MQSQTTRPALHLFRAERRRHMQHYRKLFTLTSTAFFPLAVAPDGLGNGLPLFISIDAKMSVRSERNDQNVIASFTLLHFL